MANSATGALAPNRTIRIPDEDWRRARAAAALDGKTVSDVIRDLLRTYALDALDRPATGGDRGQR